MDENTLRAWGAASSAVIIAAALFVAAPWRASADAPIALAQFAVSATDAPPPSPTPVAFAVRFKGDGPIARAQAEAASGRETRAARRIVAELDRQTAFDGLCFDRFTVNAVEIVLKSCSDIAANDRAATQTRWLARLNAMPSVEYANPAAAMREV